MVTWGWTTALEGKEPGWRDRPGTEGTTVGQPTQGREWCFIGLEPAGYAASRHGDFPLRRGVMFITTFRSSNDVLGAYLSTSMAALMVSLSWKILPHKNIDQRSQ